MHIRTQQLCNRLPHSGDSLVRVSLCEHAYTRKSACKDTKKNRIMQIFFVFCHLYVAKNTTFSFLSLFSPSKFAYIRKKLYLCTRFR